MSMLIIVIILLVICSIIAVGGIAYYYSALEEEEEDVEEEEEETVEPSVSPTTTTPAPIRKPNLPVVSTPVVSTPVVSTPVVSVPVPLHTPGEQAGCYINLGDCANSTNKPEYLSTVGPLNEYSLSSNWGLTNSLSHVSDQKCKEYTDTVYNWCGNTNQSKSYKYIAMPETAQDLTDEQAECYKARYAKLTGTIPAVKEYWKSTGFALGDYPYCRN